MGISRGRLLVLPFLGVGKSVVGVLPFLGVSKSVVGVLQPLRRQMRQQLLFEELATHATRATLLLLQCAAHTAPEIHIRLPHAAEDPRMSMGADPISTLIRQLYISTAQYLQKACFISRRALHGCFERCP